MRKQTSAATETRNEGRKMIDYTGKTIFVGIDVHKASWQVGIVHEGLILGNHSMKSDAEGLINFLKGRYKGATLKCVYESCAWGFNLQRRLTQAGIDCIVAHAGDIPGSDKEKKNKTDKVDAVRLARHHAAGLLTGIYIPGAELQKERSLIRYRKSLVRDLNRIKNRVKSLLKMEGLVIPEKLDKSNWSNNFMSWLEEQCAQDEILAVSLELMLEEVKMLRQLLLKTNKKVRVLMSSQKYNDRSTLLMTTPGIGLITSGLLLLELGDIRRFKTFDQLNSFVGFYPGSYSSGNKEKDTGISNRRHKELRSALIEAAWQAVRNDPAMLEAYQQLTKRMKGTDAIVRIARKLLRRVRKVMLSGQAYEKGVIQ